MNIKLLLLKELLDKRIEIEKNLWIEITKRILHRYINHTSVSRLQTITGDTSRLLLRAVLRIYIKYDI